MHSSLRYRNMNTNSDHHKHSSSSSSLLTFGKNRKKNQLLAGLGIAFAIFVIVMVSIVVAYGTNPAAKLWIDKIFFGKESCSSCSLIAENDVPSKGAVIEESQVISSEPAKVLDDVPIFNPEYKPTKLDSKDLLPSTAHEDDLFEGSHMINHRLQDLLEPRYTRMEKQKGKYDNMGRPMENVDPRASEQFRMGISPNIPVM